MRYSIGFLHGTRRRWHDYEEQNTCFRDSVRISSCKDSNRAPEGHSRHLAPPAGKKKLSLSPIFIQKITVISTHQWSPEIPLDTMPKKNPKNVPATCCPRKQTPGEALSHMLAG